MAPQSLSTAAKGSEQGEPGTVPKGPRMLAVTTLDGLGFWKFFAAGAYFLKKYRGVLNDLNVFPVPDGDTGSNLYLTVKAALLEANRVKDQPLNAVAAAAANGAMLGARGNSGVIFSQMLRGFAQSVQDRERIDTCELAIALRGAVAEARAALLNPVEGTILSVASAAADEASLLAPHEAEFYRFGAAIVRAASDAVERTPEQLPILREAGVVDSGGAGFLYFLEGILRFLPAAKERATAYPRRASRRRAFTHAHGVGKFKYCTEFILKEATIAPDALKDILAGAGDSLLVAGAPPLLRVHIHTDVPQTVQSHASPHGTIEKLKIDDMQQQHRILVVDAPRRAFSFVAVVPGSGFERIARELGADETLVPQAGANPSVAEILLAVRKCVAPVVVVLPNDPNLILASRLAAEAAEKECVVVPTRDAPAGLAVLISTGGRAENGPVPEIAEFEEAANHVRSASVFFAGKASNIGGLALRKGAPAAQLDGTVIGANSLEHVVVDAAARLCGNDSGLVSLYYGGRQKERDAERLAEAVRARLPKVSVECFFGGQQATEYVVSFER